MGKVNPVSYQVPESLVTNAHKISKFNPGSYQVDKLARIQCLILTHILLKITKFSSFKNKVGFCYKSSVHRQYVIGVHILYAKGIELVFDGLLDKDQ